VRILPYLGVKSLHKQIDFDRWIDDPINREARCTQLDFLLSPLDDQPPLRQDSTKAPAPTNYLFNALVFPRHRWLRFPGDILDGSSNTVFVAETLRGDGSMTATDVRRQHIVLRVRPSGARTPYDFSESLGVSEFHRNADVAGNRGSSWMDGSHLQGTFLPGRLPNDERPDVVVGPPGEIEGLSGPRSFHNIVNVVMGDGSVKPIDSRTIPYKVWFAALTPAGEWGDGGW